MRASAELPCGILPVDKPAGLTSHDVVQRVRKALGTRRVGHSGTLDPFATGLLVILVGEAARLQSVFLGKNKTYRAEMSVGRSTDTGDATGRWTCAPQSGPWKDWDGAQWQACAQQLLGESEQRPPAYSALHIDGKRSHEWARQGEIKIHPMRRIWVHRLRILAVKDTSVEFETEVSAGTYVRSLAETLAGRAGAPAHLTALRRLASGELQVDQARHESAWGPQALMPVERCLPLRASWRLGDLSETHRRSLSVGDFRFLLPRMVEDGWYSLENEATSGIDTPKAIQIFERRAGVVKMVFNRLSEFQAPSFSGSASEESAFPAS